MAADPDINLVELIERFGSEDKCRDYLEALRWPNGVECPRCGPDTTISRIEKRNQYDCDSCRYQFSVRAGTLLHDSKLPLWKWVLTTYLMVESKKGISANQVKRMVGVSYKTAWYLCHRIRHAMGLAENQDKLTGTVEADETWVGGKRKRGLPDNKTMVLGALQRGGPVRFRIEGRNDHDTLHRWIRDAVADDAEAIYTDGWRGYAGIGDEDTRHETVSHWDGEYVRGDVTANSVESVWSLFKRSIVGSYHQLSAKHLDAYLEEFAFRFNRRESPFLFRDTLRAILSGDQLTYEELTHGQTPP